VACHVILLVPRVFFDGKWLIVILRYTVSTIKKIRVNYTKTLLIVAIITKSPTIGVL
jgi:hypothetical protein